MTNVVTFAPRPQPEPALEFVQLRLCMKDCALVMTVVDEHGNTIVIKYAIASRPESFDLDRLRSAWEGWRGSTGEAS